MFVRVVLCLVLVGLAHARYQLGKGIADITGQASEGILYGYARFDQDARGVHTRQYSRAFIFADSNDRSVVVVAEITMISQAVHTEVLELLAERYGDLYTARNVMLSPTHSHSLPGGYHTYFMYSVPSGGFETPTFRAAVDGIVLSIERAHENMRAGGQVFRSAGDLTTASVNRSPYSYDANPQEERDRYEYDVDVEMTVLRLTGNDGEPMAMINLFPVHTTSMKGTNHLISADNKGYASQMTERALNGGEFPTQGVLAAFALTANGDVSPNINYERCANTDDFCFLNTTSCPEDIEDPALCTGRGPTGAIKAEENDFEDTRIIGNFQFERAMELYGEEGEELDVVTGSRFVWVNMSTLSVDIDGEQVQLCRASMGYSFAAGASDGPGIKPFTQGRLEGIPIIENITDGLFPGIKTDELIECHAPKPILLPTANIQMPYPYWQPEIVPVQVVRVGSVVFIGIPAEVTTMAGRRLQDTVREVFAELDEGPVNPVVMSMANSYSSYVVTPEEYAIQRYEAGSTIFGRYTLNGYMDIIRQLTTAMLQGEETDPGTPPPDLRGLLDEANNNPVIDTLPNGSEYGDVIRDTEPSYAPGDIAQVMFYAGNPRNNLRTDGTFLEVQRYDEGADDWTVIFTDAHWETKFYWDSECHTTILGCNLRQASNATIQWAIPEDQESGTFRLVHYGTGNRVLVGLMDYVGVSSPFTVDTSQKSDPTRPLPREVEREVDLPYEQDFFELYIYRYL